MTDDEAAPAPASATESTSGAKAVVFQVGGGKRVQSTPQMEAKATTDEDKARFEAIGKTLKAYRMAGKELIEGKYPALADLAPAALRPGNDALAILCDDGIVVRWEPMTGEKPVVRVGRANGGDRTVAFAALVASDGFVHCPVDPATFELPVVGPTIGLSTTTAATGEVSPIVQTRVGVVVPWGEQRDKPQSGLRPEPVVSISNEIEMEIHLEEFDAEDPDPKLGNGEQVVLRARVKMGQSWEQIQIFQPVNIALWNPSVAGAWAEHDLLAEATQRNLRDQKYRDLDPNLAARKKAAALLHEFEVLLDGPEEPIQTFLEKNPELLSPTHSKVWRKLPIGARKTDFVFREPWNEYVLAEIEAPSRRLYRQDGQQHADLTHAVEQTNDWLRYIEDNLNTVQQELHLTGISTSPARLVVIGRSRDLSAENRRKLTTLQNTIPKLRVLTYDDVLATARQSLENILGSLAAAQGSAEVYRIPRR